MFSLTVTGKLGTATKKIQNNMLWSNMSYKHIALYFHLKSLGLLTRPQRYEEFHSGTVRYFCIRKLPKNKVRHHNKHYHHWGNVKQIQPMLLCILKGKQFEDAHENAQGRNVIQMQPM